MASGRKGERLVSGSARLYGTLVSLYPDDYKEEYAREMRLSFGDLLREEHGRRGVRGVTLAWMNELPVLLAGAISERSVTMARTVVGAKRFINLKSLMTLNAGVLVFFGAALFVAALNLLLAYDFIAQSQIPSMKDPNSAWEEVLPVKLTTQTLGGVLMGVGVLVWAATRAVESAARTAFALALGLTHGLMALMFWANTLQYPTLLGWVSLGVSAAFALAYTVFFVGAAYRTETGSAGKTDRTGRDSARRYSSPETSSQP